MNFEKNKELFLDLTKKTLPHGKEKLMEKFLPEGIKKDGIGNYYIEIGESESMFTCHLDSATDRFSTVNHRIEYEIFCGTNGKTILSADDKSGMLIILRMIENKIPGLYYFFLGEESGCIGSRWAKQNLDFSKYKRCVSFDRRNYGNVITRQMGSRCCSTEFAESLSEQLNTHFDFDYFNQRYNELGLELDEFKFKPDPTGIFTDSAQFMGIIPECTNISVGYFNEHSHSEFQNLLYLDLLVDSVLKVDWEKLPVGVIETKKQGSWYDEFHF